jgi:hypothetical protein
MCARIRARCDEHAIFPRNRNIAEETGGISDMIGPGAQRRRGATENSRLRPMRAIADALQAMQEHLTQTAFANGANLCVTLLWRLLCRTAHCLFNALAGVMRALAAVGFFEWIVVLVAALLALAFD